MLLFDKIIMLADTGEGLAVVEPKDTLCINVRGTKFVVLRKNLLKHHPESLLAQLAQDSQNDEHSEQDTLSEIFFDRNPALVHCVLDSYITGEMHIPENSCSEAVKGELAFWKLEPEILAPCCWNRLCRAEESKLMLEKVEKEWGEMLDVSYPTPEERSSWKKQERIRWKVWLFMNEPHSSTPAKVRLQCLLL